LSPPPPAGRVPGAQADQPPPVPDVAAVTGVDGCAGGWVAVSLWPADPLALNVHVTVSVAATLAALPLAAVTGIDMPLGLLAAGWRESDLLARRALGQRGVTVFAIPPRPVWECATYAEANRTCRELTGKGFSVQAWGLRRKIAEADEFRHLQASDTFSRPQAGDSAARPPIRLYEVHPELAFTALAGAPLADSKHTKVGLAIRRDLLAQAGIILPPRVSGAAENDLLDAAAVAWSARRIAAGNAITLTNLAQQSDDGSEIAIRY
jgi:predicted RNase H-like nuclease